MKLVKEIRSRTGKLHFQRWRVLWTPWFSIFVHRILEKDQDKHCHDHPWSFFSLILWGHYFQLRFTSADGHSQNQDLQLRRRSLFTWERTPAEGVFHKIYEVPTPTWSLILAGPSRRVWGYATEEGWVNNVDYRSLKHAGYWDAHEEPVIPSESS